MRHEAGSVLTNCVFHSSESGKCFSALERRRPDGMAWSTGNTVETLVHGATYFGRLLETIRGLGPGDQLYFTDWRGDPDQLLSDDPDSRVGPVLGGAGRRGGVVGGFGGRVC